MKFRLQKKKFHSVYEFSIGFVQNFLIAFIEREGNPELLQEGIESEIKMKKAIAALRGEDKPLGFEKARRILGANFIPPREIEETGLVSYSYDQIKHYKEAIPSGDDLYWLVNNNYALIAGPPEPLSARQLINLRPKLIDHRFDLKEDKFLSRDKVGNNWLMIRKKSVAGAAGDAIEYQLKKLRKNEEIPNFTELAWGIMAYKLVRDVFLFEDDFSLRTTSTDRYARHITVYIPINTISPYGHWGSDPADHISIPSKRK